MNAKFVIMSLACIIIILSLSLIGLQGLEKKATRGGTATLVIVTLGNTTTEIVAANGSTVLQLLNQKHSYELVPTAPNQMIKCLDGICNQDSFWWQFRVNNKLVLNSVEKYKPNNGDVITLKYGDER